MKIKDKQVLVFYAEKQVILYNESIDEVKKRIESELKENENDIKLLSIYAQILHQYDNDYILALKYIKKILQLNKKDVDARLELIIIMLQYFVGNTDDCQNILNECLKIDDNYWRTHFIQIKYYDFLLKSNSFMMKEIKLLLNRFPNNPWITVYYWQIAGDEDELSLQDVNMELIENSEYLDFEMLRRIAYYFQRVDKNNLAEQLQKQSLKLNPKSFVNLNNYAQLLRDSFNNNKDCIYYCQKSLEYNPRYVMAMLNLAFTYQFLEKYEISNKLIKNLIEIQNTKSIFFEGLIQNYINLEQTDKAMLYCQKANKKFPNNYEINVMYSYELIQHQIYTEGIETDFEYVEIVLFNNLDLFINQPNYDSDYYYIINHMNYIYGDNDADYNIIEI
ncbi:tetratricopeptide repeat protein (macronuclear) [Tetrahymena thermophila SB210]|uniref:Tetratricopeptide repeat protein n=1 Tax=Tetrahymena thermophila (strain SB210) TaxID=312017 RepID=Q22RY1_TETTS|nr:tetratricopeptide repeat protein [Tetrahymena thermophila SB210]EAR87991.1 tetratricopeptide repeat protein [Tetrahymena thermophila SB210]|eukprot:XP_001008236.1 tetratricopeptide repeat protein [Tetrahymena thermophila SB210]